MRARNNRIMLRLSDKEYESLIKSSEKVGVPREVYLRMLIMGTTPKEKPTADFYNMTRELNAIGNSLKWTEDILEAEEKRAYEDDEFCIGEDWQMADFMKAIGYSYDWEN